VRRPPRAGVLYAGRHRRRARQGRRAQEGIGVERASRVPDVAMKFSLTTPRGALVEADVDEVTAPGALGEFGVLPGHVPLMSALRPGVLVYRAKDASGPRSGVIAVGAGFLQVAAPNQSDTANDRVLVLVDQA